MQHTTPIVGMPHANKKDLAENGWRLRFSYQ
jgi:hypothetical protein